MTEPTKITLTTSRDCGCEISDAEFARYLRCVESAIEDAYPGADVTARQGLVVATQATAYDASGAEVDDAAETAKGIAQDVWDAGGFWGAAESV